MLTILQGNCLEKLREIPDGSVHCCVTSPPYWGLRDYGLEPSVFGGQKDCQHDWTESRYYNEKTAARSSAGAFSEPDEANKARLKEGRWRKDSTCRHCGAWLGQLGLEPTPDMFVDHLVEIFREVKRTLRDDGTLWLNLGDSYAGSYGNQGRKEERGTQRPVNGAMLQNVHDDRYPNTGGGTGLLSRTPGLKNKDLIGVPWRAAFALQEDGWYLRSGIPWLKRSCMPESVTDRPTTALEYVFLLSKTDDYYFDKDAVSMPLAASSGPRLAQDVEAQGGSARANGGGKTNGTMKAVASGKWSSQAEHASGKRLIDRVKEARANGGDHDNPFGPRRNIRNSDWFFQSLNGLIGNEDGEPLAFIVNPQGYKDAHFATWPEKLVRPMITAGSPVGGTVLDVFGGSGTTGKVSLENGRNAILCELNPEYVKLIRQRCETTVGLSL